MATDKPTTDEEMEIETPLEEKVEETPVVEETSTEDISDVEEKSEQPVEDETSESTPPVSRRKAERLQKLESLVSRLKGEDVAQVAPRPNGLDYRTALDADEEVVQTLESDRKAYGETAFNAGLEQAKSIQFHTRLEIDAPKIESKYPTFDQNSEEFKPGVANAVNSWYLATVGYDARTDTVKNSTIRYSDFVEGVMELADSMAGEKVATTQKNIAKQAAQTGLRPDGSSPKRLNLNQAPEDMTVEELNAAISQGMRK